MNQSMCCDSCLTPLSEESLYSRVTEVMFVPMASEAGYFVDKQFEVTFNFCSPECQLLRMSTEDPRD